MPMLDVRLALAVAVAGALGFQGTAKDPNELAKGTQVRVASRALAAGWHEGEVTTATPSQKQTCYGVSVKMPNSRTGKAVVYFDGIDSIDVKVKLSKADSAAHKPEWKRMDAKALMAKYPGCKPAP
jgi:ABC-type proline/glycine betaine transport system substrate-binding protein